MLKKLSFRAEMNELFRQQDEFIEFLENTHALDAVVEVFIKSNSVVVSMDANHKDAENQCEIIKNRFPSLQILKLYDEDEIVIGISDCL